MSTIKEFYIDKEKRELINTINSAKYVSENQKETMIAVMLKEDVVDQLRSVVKKKNESDIKFKSGTSVPIDPESA